MIYNDLDHERGLDDLSDLFERALSAVEVRETKRQETRLSAIGCCTRVSGRELSVMRSDRIVRARQGLLVPLYTTFFSVGWRSVKRSNRFLVGASTHILALLYYYGGP